MGQSSCLPSSSSEAVYTRWCKGAPTRIPTNLRRRQFSGANPCRPGSLCESSLCRSPWTPPGLASLVLSPTVQDSIFKEEPPSMKKLLTLLATMAVAACLSMPAFAQDAQQAPAESAPQSAPSKKESKKKHSKKKEKKSKKKMESTEPSGQ